MAPATADKAAKPVDATGEGSEDKKGKKKPRVDEEDDGLSEADRAIKERMEELVEALQSVDVAEVTNASEELVKEIKESTGSMTSVPKPLKFLRAHMDTIRGVFDATPDVHNRKRVADVLSILSMTVADETGIQSLTFKLAGNPADLDAWGMEYLRNLTGQLGREYQKRLDADEGDAAATFDDLHVMVNQLVPYFMTHNAVHEAVDLLVEVEQVERIKEFADASNYAKVCEYLATCAQYLPEPDDGVLLRIAKDVYVAQKQLPPALLVALRAGDLEAARGVYDAATAEMTDGDEAAAALLKKQLALMLGRHRVLLPEYEEEDEDLLNLLSNTDLTEHFLNVARELDVMEPKAPEDVYKSHLSDGAGGEAVSARGNLASTFVNAFVNAGFGSDKLMLDEGSTWLYKNNDHGQMSAAASLGLLMLWDVDGGLTHIDKYLYSDDAHVKAGALLAAGVVNTGVVNDCDPALGLLSEHVSGKEPMLRVGSILGLGLAYAGSQREELLELLTPVVCDSSLGVQSAAYAALALGMVFVGSCNEDAAMSIMQALMDRAERGLKDTLARFLALGLGLVFLGRQDSCDGMLEAIKVLENAELKAYTALTVETCAYAGTGNVLKVQELLSTAGDHLTVETNASNSSDGSDGSDGTTNTNTNTEGGDNNTGGTSGGEDDAHVEDAHQAVAVLGVALVAMGEGIGESMVLRSMLNLLQYGDLNVRRVVPLALALLGVSKADLNIAEVLTKLTHDHDPDVATNAIFALGLLGAGTNHARIAQQLRDLANYYQREPTLLYVVRLAQGLVYMGKGLVTLNPFFSGTAPMSKVAVGGLLAVLHAMFDASSTIVGKEHYLLYMLTAAVQSRMLVTVDTELKPLPVTVRVGQAVDTVGQAGKPKRITGFQTHKTPVLIAHGDRAELADDEYIPVSSVLEGVVIVRKNPEWE